MTAVSEREHDHRVAAGARALPLRSGAAPTHARPRWAWARALVGMGILALLVWWVGTGPFLDGIRAQRRRSLLAFGIGVVTTRLRLAVDLVAAGLGVRLPVRDAVAAYYRSQFLNTTLPGGVLGDVHRAVRHGRDIGDVRLGVRAVVLDRVAGQVVQVLLAAVVLCPLPVPGARVPSGRGRHPRRGGGARRRGLADCGPPIADPHPGAPPGRHRPARQRLRPRQLGRRRGGVHRGGTRSPRHLPARGPGRELDGAVGVLMPLAAARPARDGRYR